MLSTPTIVEGCIVLLVLFLDVKKVVICSVPLVLFLDVEKVVICYVPLVLFLDVEKVVICYVPLVVLVPDMSSTGVKCLLTFVCQSSR